MVSNLVWDVLGIVFDFLSDQKFMLNRLVLFTSNLVSLGRVDVYISMMWRRISGKLPKGNDPPTTDCRSTERRRSVSEYNVMVTNGVRGVHPTRVRK